MPPSDDDDVMFHVKRGLLSKAERSEHHVQYSFGIDSPNNPFKVRGCQSHPLRMDLQGIKLKARDCINQNRSAIENGLFMP